MGINNAQTGIGTFTAINSNPRSPSFFFSFLLLMLICSLSPSLCLSVCVSNPAQNHIPAVRNPASFWLPFLSPAHCFLPHTVFAVERESQCILLLFDFQLKLKRSLYRDEDTQLSKGPLRKSSMGLLSVKCSIKSSNKRLML